MDIFYVLNIWVRLFNCLCYLFQEIERNILSKTVPDENQVLWVVLHSFRIGNSIMCFGTNQKTLCYYRRIERAPITCHRLIVKIFTLVKNLILSLYCFVLWFIYCFILIFVVLFFRLNNYSEVIFIKYRNKANHLTILISNKQKYFSCGLY